MRRIITVCLLLFFANMSFAQQDTTLVYNSPMYTKDPVRSKWKPVVKRMGDLFQVSFYDRKNLLKEVISFEDKELTIRKGPYKLYRELVLREEGAYDKGYKNGEWRTYITVDGQPIVKKVEQYYYAKLHGKYIENWPNKQVMEEGNYEAGRKIGEWNLFYRDGKPAGKELYDVYGKKTDGQYFLNDGSPTNYDILFTKPTYKGGMQEFYKYLASEIKYPKQAAKDRIKGTVYLSFTVKTDGRVEDVQVIKSPDYELSDEAVRVVEKSRDWTPGKMYGETVNVRYNIPIKFSLP